MPFIFNVVAGRKKTTPSSTLSYGLVDGYQFHGNRLDGNGNILSWGANFYGQLGDNSTIDKCTPVSLGGLSKTFCTISSGFAHVIATDINGKAWVWGNGDYGKLGDNSVTGKCTPVSVYGNKTFCQVAAGVTHTVAIDNNGKLWAWGSNAVGELGDNTTTSRSTPVAVCNTRTFCKVTAGGNINEGYSFAIDKDGQAWGWGINSNYQLGDNSFVSSRRTPVSVGGLTKTFCEINISISNTLAIDKNGKAWTWGSPIYGDGTGNGFAKNTPVAVNYGNTSYCKIAGGIYAKLAIDNNGQIWSWGFNNFGQLGDGTTTNRALPVSIAGNTKTFCEIGAGAYISFAVDKDGQVWGWGWNVYGGLGDGTTTNRCTPVRVCNL